MSVYKDTVWFKEGRDIIKHKLETLCIDSSRYSKPEELTWSDEKAVTTYMKQYIIKILDEIDNYYIIDTCTTQSYNGIPEEGNTKHHDITEEKTIETSGAIYIEHVDVLNL